MSLLTDTFSFSMPEFLILFELQPLMKIATGFLFSNAIELYAAWIFTVAIGIVLLLSAYLLFRSGWSNIVVSKSDRKVEQTKKWLYPYIQAVLEEGKSRELVVEQIQNEDDMIIFEEMIFDELDQLNGRDGSLYRRLLSIPRLYKYRQKQLFSKDVSERIQACYYFRYLIDESEEAVNRLTYLLESDEKELIHAAALALMHSGKISIREQTLGVVAGNKKLDKPALLEVIHAFYHGQVNEEIPALKRLIQEITIPEKHTALIIQSIIQMKYTAMGEFLFDYYRNNTRWDPECKMREALITALGNLQVIEAADSIANDQAGSKKPAIRSASARALGSFGDPRYVDTLEKLAKDEAFEVRIDSVLALAKCGTEGEKVLERLIRQENRFRFNANCEWTHKQNQRQVA